MSPGKATPGAAASGPLAPSDRALVHTDDTLRHVAYVMAETGHTVLPVTDRVDPSIGIGTISLEQLLAGRLRDLHEERHSERVLRPLSLIGLGRESKEAAG